MNPNSESLEDVIEYNIMVSFFGDDKTAVQAANVLWRKNIHSMEELDELSKRFSALGFSEYIRDLKNVGIAMENRILSGLKEFRGDAEGAQSGAADSRQNFRRRLYWTARHLRDLGPDLFPEVEDGTGHKAGLTAQDIVLLSRLLGKK